MGRSPPPRGAVDQSNFHDYTITRMDDAPLDVRTHIVEDFTHLRPCGVGEPGVPPYTPALVNAIYQRHRQAHPQTADRRSTHVCVTPQMTGRRGMRDPPPPFFLFISDEATRLDQ